jgi:hypothetical protein
MCLLQLQLGFHILFSLLSCRLTLMTGALSLHEPDILHLTCSVVRRQALDLEP